MSNEMTTDNMSNEEVIEVLKGLVFNSFDRTTSKERQALHLAIRALEEQPQGKWKETGYETGALGITYRQTQCSNCGWEHALPMWWNFCPNCGADMRKGSDSK